MSTPSHPLRAAFRAELKPTIRLAVPVVASELAWMTMGVVDTLMVGRLSSLALGAVGLGHSAFFFVAVFGIGLAMGLDYIVGKAFGSGDKLGALEALIQGCYLSLAASIPLVVILLMMPTALLKFGVDAEIIAETRLYLNAVALSLPPLLLYNALRRYLQAIDVARAVAIILVATNVVNVVADWALIFGHLGLPAMGVQGAGLATLLSRVLMAVGLFWVVLQVIKREKLPWRKLSLKPDSVRLKALLVLGGPAAMHMGIEVGGFTFATFLAGKLGTSALAAHQIALTVASYAFTIPLGLSTAGAVRVSQGLGRQDPMGAVAAGWVTLALALGMMGFSAFTLGFFRFDIVRLFTPIPELLPIGGALLLLAAFFQLFDAVQAVTAGILRGLGDTTSAMYANLFGHWMVGLPVGYYLAFHGGVGIEGLWIGLSVGLGLVSVILMIVWLRKTRGGQLTSPENPA